jgi:hypothetical protein
MYGRRHSLQGRSLGDMYGTAKGWEAQPCGGAGYGGPYGIARVTAGTGKRSVDG